MKSFSGKKFLIYKNFLKKEEATLAGQYLINRSIVTKTFMDSKYISPFDQSLGCFSDSQAPNTFSIYGDVLMDTILSMHMQKLEKKIKTKLFPTYSYARVYKKGDILVRHKDRKSCEISATINLLSDKQWPIFLDPTGEIGNKGVKVNLKQGDALFYFGAEHEHWREEYTGNYCSQLFIHYNTKKYKHLLYDTRPHLGLPAEFANKHEV